VAFGQRAERGPLEVGLRGGPLLRLASALLLRCKTGAFRSASKERTVSLRHGGHSPISPTGQEEMLENRADLARQRTFTVASGPINEA
jgi:hypothetical protein